jgi:hypothetical protein
MRSEPSGPRRRRRVYDDAVREALILVWEASDRVCGKRLRPLIPILVESMERHGHLKLAEAEIGESTYARVRVAPVLGPRSASMHGL